MKLLTSRSQGELDTWYVKALADSAVAPYLSFATYWEIPQVEDTSWASMCFLGDVTYLSISPNRDRGYAAVSMWTLDPKNNRTSSAMALRFAMKAVKHENLNRVCTGVHSTNAASLRLNKRLFGEPWGVEPNSAWDREKMKWVDTVHFSRSLV